MSFPVQLTSSASGDSWVVDTTSADGHAREIVVVAGLGYLFLTQTDLHDFSPDSSDPLDRDIYGMEVADATGTIFSGFHTGHATTVDVDADGNYAIDRAVPNPSYHFNGSLQTGMPWIAAATFSPTETVWIFYDATPYAGRTVSVVIVPEEDNLLRSPRGVASFTPISGVGGCAFSQIPPGVYIVKARVDGEIIQSHGRFVIGTPQPQRMPSYPHWMSLTAVASPPQFYGVSMSGAGNSLWTSALSGGTWSSFQPLGLPAPALDVAAAAGPQSNDTAVAVLDVNGKIRVRLGNASVNAGVPPQPAPMTDIALDVEGTVLHLAAIDQMGSLWTAWSVGSSGIFTRQRTPTGPGNLVDVATAGGSAFCVDTDGGAWVLDSAWVATPAPSWSRLLTGSPPALQQIAVTQGSGGQVLVAGIDSNGVVWVGARASIGGQATLSAIAAPVTFAGEVAISATDIWAVSTYGELWRYDRAGQFWDGPAWNGLHLRNDRPFLDLYASAGSDQEVGVLVANAPPASRCGG